MAVDLLNDLLLSCVGEEVRGVATETLSQAKQMRKEQLEALKQRFLWKQLQKYWNK